MAHRQIIVECAFFPIRIDFDRGIIYPTAASIHEESVSNVAVPAIVGAVYDRPQSRTLRAVIDRPYSFLRWEFASAKREWFSKCSHRCPPASHDSQRASRSPPSQHPT